MSAQRAARPAAPAPGPCRLTGFDSINLEGARSHLESARASLDAVRPKDPGMAERLAALRRRLAELIQALDLDGTP